MFGRTLVLAKIDAQKENLVTMLAGVKEQIALSDEQLLEIDKRLLVCSMKDLKEKFPYFCSHSRNLEESVSPSVPNDFAKAIEEQAAEGFEVWCRKKQTVKNSQKNCTREQHKEIELYMGIQTFFQHSKDGTRGLLFLNMSLEELLETKNKDKLQLYLNTVNHKADKSQTIQFAILPEVEMPYGKTLVRERFLGTREREKNVTQAQVMEIAALLALHKVMLCYQYETGERTSPEAFAREGRERYQQESAVFERKTYSEYMCCCYPNLSSPKKNIYIGAAFVAAGMLASHSKEGSQTMLPKELYPYTQTTREELKKEKYGCFLSSETAEKGWAAIRSMVLFSARTLACSQGKYVRVEKILEGLKEREK